MFRKRIVYLAGPLGVLLVAVVLFSALVTASSPVDSSSRLDTICDVPGDYASIQAAVDDPACGTINLGTGTFYENVAISRTVTIQGQGPASTAVDGNASGRVFTIELSAVVTLTNMTIRGGAASGAGRGGGVMSLGAATLDSVMVTENQAFNGGGIAADWGSLILNNSTVHHNHTTGNSGAGIISQTALTVTNSTISDNWTTGAGGGLGVFGITATLINSTISGNSTTGSGGGLYVSPNPPAPGYDPPVVYALNTIIANNTAPNSGADCSGTLNSLDYNLIESTSGCSITGTITHNITNQDPNLGPLQDNGGPTLTHALLRGSPAIDAGDDAACPATDQRGVARPQDGDGDGTARCDMGAFELVICDVPGDYASIQAAVDDPACGTINLGTGTFYENVAISRTVTIQGQGAASTRVDGSASGSVFDITASATVTLSRMMIANGSALSGGGIYVYAGVLESKTVHVIDSTITGNAATSGGGIFSSGYRMGDATVYLTNSTVSGNTASEIGGGICNAVYAQVYVTNSTLSGNSAGQGGGIYNSGGKVVVASSTLSDNSASQGGDIYNVWYDEAPYGGYKYFGAINSIVANSPNGGDCVNDVDGRFADNGYNIVEDGSCISDSTSSSGDPVLGPLQDNGGPTLTHALLRDSPAIDTGDEAACPATDQRGVARPQDGDGDGTARCDIGAFELVKGIVFLPLVER